MINPFHAGEKILVLEEIWKKSIYFQQLLKITLGDNKDYVNLLKMNKKTNISGFCMYLGVFSNRLILIVGGLEGPQK